MTNFKIGNKIKLINDNSRYIIIDVVKGFVTIEQLDGERYFWDDGTPQIIPIEKIERIVI